MLLGYMSFPHRTEAVIHSDAIRKELKHWHAPCAAGRACLEDFKCAGADGGTDSDERDNDLMDDDGS